MPRCSTTLAVVVGFLAAGAPAVAQDGYYLPSVEPPERSAGQTIVPAMTATGLPGPTTPPPPSPSLSLPALTGGPIPLPPTPPSTGPSAASRREWSLGDDGPMSTFAAPDLYPQNQALGWYAEVDLGIMKPNLKNLLTTPAGYVSPTGNAITLPAAPLDWAAVPTLNFGYRFGEGFGEFRFAYRLLASAGDEAAPGLDAAGLGQLRSRIDIQTFDFDYISQEYLNEGKDISRAFFRDIRGGIGIRVASTFFDSHAAGTIVTDQHVSSSFAGLGPRMFLELRQDLGRTDFQLYSRVIASGVLGPVRQQFSDTVQTPGGPNNGYYDTHNQSNAMGVLQVEAGFSWEPDRLARRFRLTAAYSWERWWDLGSTSDSNAELTLQGVLLRAEYRY